MGFAGSCFLVLPVVDPGLAVLRVIKSNQTGKASRFENSPLGEGEKVKCDTESIQKMYKCFVIFLKQVIQRQILIRGL